MSHRNSPESFWGRTAPDGECIVWTGARHKRGYGQVRWWGRVELAHRVAFFLRMGRWPDTELRHLCNNPACVLHAVEGSHSENMRDRRLAGTCRNSAKTHCPQGHPYDEKNTYTSKKGSRHCKACALERYHRARRETGEAA